MAEEQSKGPPKTFDELKEKIDKKKTTDIQEVIKQIATRDKLERDYEEDILYVTFYSSPETKRTVLAKRPTQKEMMTIMRLSAEAAIYEGKMDNNSLDKMVSIYEKLPELATSAVAAYKKKTDIAIGNIVGSNIFNILLILGISAMIGPLPFSVESNIDIGVAILAPLLLFITMFTGRKKHLLERWEGVLFLLIYIIYISFIIIRG